MRDSDLKEEPTPVKVSLDQVLGLEILVSVSRQAKPIERDEDEDDSEETSEPSKLEQLTKKFVKPFLRLLTETALNKLIKELDT